MTRRNEVDGLAYNKPYPKQNGGKRKVYEEVFINSGGEPSAALAKRHLRNIQECHPVDCGWYANPDHEGVFLDSDGLWYAYRHQAKYA